MLNRLYIFNHFFNNNSFRKCFFKSLTMDSFCRLIRLRSLSITKCVCFWINIPCIFAWSLTTCRNISMSFFIHFSKFCLLISSSILRKKEIFCAFTLITTYSKSKLLVLNSWRPFVISLIRSSKWFFFMSHIVTFFDIVEFISQAIQILWFDDITKFFWKLCLFSQYFISIKLVNILF